MNGELGELSQKNVHAIDGALNLFDLPEELLLAALGHLSNSELYKCAQLSKSFNRLAVQKMLDHHEAPNVQNCCTITTTPSCKFDALSALLISVHVDSLKSLKYILVSFASYLQVGPQLARLHRLIARLTSVEEVAIHFNTNGCKDFNEEQFKEIVLILQDLLNAIVAKSCRKLRFMGSRNLLTNHYQFLLNEKGPRSLINGVKNFVTRRKVDTIQYQITHDDWRYWRRGSRIFLTSSPAALENTELEHFNIGTLDLLRPPFSKWTFTTLRASPMTSLSVFLQQMQPTDKEENQFIFSRLSSAVPRLTRLYLDKPNPALIPEILVWVNQFSLLETFGIQSLSSPFQLDTALIPSYSLNLDKLQTIDATPEVLSYLAAHTIKCPQLKYVHISYNCIDGVRFDPQVLVQAIADARRSFNPDTIPRIYLKFDAEFPGITKSFCDGVRPDSDGWEKEVMGIDALRIRILEPKPAIKSGKFLRQSLGVLTLFPNLKYLSFDSLIVGSAAAIERFDPYLFDVFKSRCPKLRDMTVQ